MNKLLILQPKCSSIYCEEPELRCCAIKPGYCTITITHNCLQLWTLSARTLNARSLCCAIGLSQPVFLCLDSGIKRARSFHSSLLEEPSAFCLIPGPSVCERRRDMLSKPRPSYLWLEYCSMVPRAQLRQLNHPVSHALGEKSPPKATTDISQKRVGILKYNL